MFFAAFSISTLGTAAVPIAVSFALLGAGYSASAVGAALVAQTPAAASAPLSMAPQKAAWGLIAAATGVGGIASGLLVLHVHIPRPLLAVQLATALLVTPLVMLALHAPVPLLALGSATFGVALAVVNVLVQTSLQESIPRAFLSRVSSMFGLVTMGLGSIGFALCGPVASLIGTELALGLGACALLASVAALLASYDIQRFTSFRNQSSAQRKRTAATCLQRGHRTFCAKLRAKRHAAVPHLGVGADPPAHAAVAQVQAA